MSGKSIAALAKRFPVIAPEYPPIRTMDALVDGIAEILRRAGVAKAHVVGGSDGGFVAQVFVRRHPESSRSVVLSRTRPPEPESGAAVRRATRLLAILPGRMLRARLRSRLRNLLPPRTAESAGLHAIFDEMSRYRLEKADLVALLERPVDFTCKVFSPNDLSRWPGELLLALADDDPSTPEAIRLRLQELHPGAKLHLFHGGGHATSVVKEAEYLAVVEEFLAAH